MAPNPMRSPWFGITLCDYSITSAGQLVTVAYIVHLASYCFSEESKGYVASLEFSPWHLPGFLWAPFAKPKVACTEPWAGRELSIFLILIHRASRSIPKAVIVSGDRETLKKLSDQLEKNLYQRTE